ncbi:MAG: preprotein translocase subunit SecG [Candidatus Zambryskibacteria bacterium RIFCSPHIGHO2_01_FULL_49_18]|uniref:Protein-export membrane protein SecG n=2 Tax=Candidatus Zambryskiibacteriota TaxID=1817925 RepID=A0A1G2T1X6_9BACT|nr:MAG: preprotein translocase subunit SecG [Candidatus Zambryskibacteria bacterium RIFCSPHIGHO2_01_FULL_49_18]OHB06171.1 MAG: preprotein translocase subunit SecG [Candidatus Zambryskibacteria bacterium RIFCSPLOWO2_01_FULL_47_14]
MVQALPYIQIVLSVLLVAGILLQRSEASLGSAFGSDSAGGTRFTRRGFEKTLFNGTILIAVLFVLSAFASLLLPR